MASAYSIARTYNEFIPPVDLQLMSEAMAAKQQKYDTNYAAIQGQLTNYGNLDIIKEEDKQYFYDRASKLVNDINQYGKVDLSSNAITTQIANHVGQVIDDNVVNALASGQVYRGYQAEIEKIKEKNPEKYSVVNEMYGMVPFGKWLHDGKAGTKLGAMHYNPFSDVQEKYNKRVKDIVDSKGRTKFDVPNGRGQIISKEYGGLTEMDIKSIVENSLTPDERQQLAINGWYDLGQANPKEANGHLNNYAQQKLVESQGQIEFLATELAARGGKDEDIENEIYKLKKNQEYLIESTSKLQGASTERIGEFMQKENLIGNLYTSYKHEIKSVELKKDEAHFATLDYNLNSAKFELDQFKHQLEVEKFDYQKQTDAAKENALTGEYYSGTTGLNDVNVVSETVDRMTNEDKAISTSLDEIVNSNKGLTDNQKALYNAQGSIEAKMKFLEENGTSEIKDKISEAGINSKYANNIKDKELFYNATKEIADEHKKVTKKDDHTLAAIYASFYNSSIEVDEKIYYKTLISSLGRNADEYIKNDDKNEGQTYKVSVKNKRGLSKSITFSTLAEAEEYKKTHSNEDIIIRKSRILTPVWNKKDKYYETFSESTIKNLQYNGANKESFLSKMNDIQPNMIVNKGRTFREGHSLIGQLTTLANAYSKEFGGQAVDEKKTIHVQKEEDGTVGIYQYEATTKGESLIRKATIPKSEANRVLKPAGYDIDFIDDKNRNFVVPNKTIKGQALIKEADPQNVLSSEKYFRSNTQINTVVLPKDFKDYFVKGLNSTYKASALIAEAPNMTFKILPDADPSMPVNIEIKGKDGVIIGYHTIDKNMWNSTTYESITRYPQQILTSFLIDKDNQEKQK